MKLDFFGFGGGDAAAPPAAPAPQADAPDPKRRGARMRVPKGLLKRYMRERLEVRPLDDAQPTIRVGMIAAILFFGLFLGFAMLAPISGAAIAEGKVTTNGNKMLIQPVAGGLVAEIKVKEGQLVQAGDPLVQLNGIRSGAELKQAQARRDGLRALEARLVAERDGLEQLNFPQELLARQNDPATMEAMRSQYALWQRHQQILAADRTLADSQATAAEARQLASQQQLSLLNQELSGIVALERRGFASKNRVLGMRRNAAELTAQLAGSNAQMQQAQIQQQRTRDAQTMEIVAELNRVQSELAQVEPQLELSRYTADQDVLRAPVTGRVAGLAQVGPGTVVGSGQTLMEIVPTEGTLVVDARVKPEDIDDVQVGAEAMVRFSTVNPHGQSAFAGKVITLSPTQIDDGQGGGYFRAQVAIDDPAELQRAGVELQPGVPASVNITTDSRSLWDYLMSPLGDAFSRSFREE